MNIYWNTEYLICPKKVKKEDHRRVLKYDTIILREKEGRKEGRKREGKREK